MRRNKIIHMVGFVTAALFSMGVANAAPAGQVNTVNKMVDRSAGAGHLVPVKGCHRKATRHMVYKWGKRAWHRHRNNCAPVRVKRGFKKRGYRGKGCHRNFRKHRHAGWGGGWHRHRGQNCYPRRGKARRGYQKGCFKIGPVYVCP